MVLLAAAIATKGGKPLLSRQFVEMTRARIEGLLAAFPKLLGSDKSSATKQHTFVETESVRYVYQPMDQLYVLLITTKASNILEDLETLRLFSRVIPEYCRTMDEKTILEQAFQLIFAFDEIVALGYRENVNLARIRTFTDMDSHEERVYWQIKKTQEEEAKKLMKDRAREITKQKQDALKRGGGQGRMPGSGMGAMGGYGPQSAKYGDLAAASVDSAVPELKPAYTAPASTRKGPNKAMVLGSKKVDEDTFISQLKNEGQDVAAAVGVGSRSKTGGAAPSQANVGTLKMEPVHLRTEEKLSLVMSRDGGVEQLEAHGLVTLRVSEENFSKIKVNMNNQDRKGAQVQTHPNLDKKAWQSESVLTLKNPAKPFPVNNDVGVLKWRFQTQDEEHVPLQINCWPSESGQGCEVNIEYTLENEDLELKDVVIYIPLPSGVSPVIGECEGEYKHDRARNTLEWRLPVVDASNKTGTLEFTTHGGHADNFFPVRVSFVSPTLFCNITPLEVLFVDDGNPAKFSSETALLVEKYEIV